MRRLFYITTLLMIVIIGYLGITYSFEYNTDDTINFEIIGPSTLYVDVNTKYEEYGVKVTFNGLDITNKVIIDSSSIDTSKLGEYEVKYSVDSEYVKRKVIVIDKKAPVIKLVGGDEVYVLLNGTYQEFGYTVSDNYDKDLDNKVVVSGNVNTSVEGTYEVKYTVVDSSSNVGEVTRKVIVKKGLISLESGSGNRPTATGYNVWQYSNSVTSNRFTSTGFHLEGHSNNNVSDYKIKLKNRENIIEYTFDGIRIGNNSYAADIDVTNIYNGVYDLYVVSNGEERVLNRLSDLARLVRAHIGDKLITFMYDNDFVSIDISDFKYEYDIVIDPGHGGSDIGTANGLIPEKSVNLMISNYEKCRYESMGYKVYLLRNNDTYGDVLGPSSIESLDRKGIAIGYYGSVSKISYSNHHNGSYSTSNHGFEIIVGNQLTALELAPEKKIYDRFMEFYGLVPDTYRMYSKNYDTDQVYNKSNGEVYDITNYYAVIRIPYELFNVKNIIYEPIYMTNQDDFNWYYYMGHYVDVSEIKIREYVNYLGGKYNSDNSKCL